MIPVDPYEVLQDDIVTYLQTDANLSTVFLFASKPGDIQSDVFRALSGLRVTGGKSGAAIEVGKPFMVNPGEEGLDAFIEMRFLVKTLPTINNGATGTGIAAQALSKYLVETLLEWGSEGIMSGSWFPSANFDSPAHFDGDQKAVEGRLVVMRSKLAIVPQTRTVTPIVAGDPGAVTISVAAPDASAPILYTTDGSCPGYEQGTTTPAGTTKLYAGAFTVASGAVVRAMAVAPGKVPSIVNYSTVT